MENVSYGLIGMCMPGENFPLLRSGGVAYVIDQFWTDIAIIQDRGAF